MGTSLVVQWLRLHVTNTGDPGSIPGQKTRSHLLQMRVHVPQLKSPHTATKSCVCVCVSVAVCVCVCVCVYVCVSRSVMSDSLRPYGL